MECEIAFCLRQTVSVRLCDLLKETKGLQMVIRKYKNNNMADQKKRSTNVDSRVR